MRYLSEAPTSYEAALDYLVSIFGHRCDFRIGRRNFEVMVSPHSRHTDTGEIFDYFLLNRKGKPHRRVFPVGELSVVEAELFEVQCDSLGDLIPKVYEAVYRRRTNRAGISALVGSFSSFQEH